MSTAAAGLYVHVPFCSAICPYCDFAVLVGSPNQRASFVASLVTELDTVVAFPPIDTIYFGGGTPSLLAVDDLSTILRAIERALTIRPERSLFIEVNPEDASAARLTNLRELGFDFVSLGVQSFDDSRLRFLGRRHSAEVARASVDAARAAGFGTVSLDLIYGLPGDTLEVLLAELDRSIAAAPDHISCYQLSMPEGTPFGRAATAGKLIELDEDPQADLFVAVHEHLRASGYEPYEVSNFSRAVEHRSRHNQKYWNHVPYLGIGPAAHSFDGQSRWWNERELATWSARLSKHESAVADRELLDLGQLALEHVMLRLRTAKGLDLATFSDRFGIDLAASNSSLIKSLEQSQQVECEAGFLRLTTRGMAVADGISREIAMNFAFT